MTLNFNFTPIINLMVLENLVTNFKIHSFEVDIQYMFLICSEMGNYCFDLDLDKNIRNKMGNSNMIKWG